MPSIKLTIAAILLCAAPGALVAQDEPDPYVGLAAPLDPAAASAVAGINHFTLDLYKRSAGPADNVFLSPASVSTAMALAYRGARGRTAGELQRVLHYSAPPESYLSAQAPLLRAMTFAGRGRELSTNNGLWVQDGLPMNAAYLADVADHAGAGLRRVDYVADPDRARATINGWVSGKTGDRIKELLSSDNVKRDTRAILVNTIYWKANWARQFDPASTRNGPFHRLDGGTVPVALMNQTADFQVLDRGDLKAIQLPYGNGEVSMVVLMPDNAKGLSKFEAGLTDPGLTRLLGDLDKAAARPTLLTLPRMHLKWRGNLVDTFRAMGVETAFDERADFSGMATVPREQVLAIGAIIHQSWLDVDEKGSEAAAATAVVDVIITGARRGPPPSPPFVFRADKPFLFLLRDRRTGMILFIGRYLGPAAT